MIRSRSLDILRLLRAASLLLLVIAFSARSELRAIPATSRQFLRRTLPRALAKYIFSTAAVEAYSTYQLPGDGDLWQSC
jgi:hypothetical protein